ncbi:GNAT family N-acetyltransferase [Microvirga alba]|uniref:GNAT family N-acetyltransferase n=1 Tax=Microvirga alba TaxID=2791025 RepID=A0A931BQF1_9HYPH|nr:GNAT family N-acetyltransferase [Microvirga alba]MBF9235561.1 GNAT family N-acetyltransferase [Microvirga alba]
MDYIIRLADNTRPATLKLLRRLHSECLPYDKLPNFTEGFWWIAYHGDDAVGFAGMVRSARWIDAGYMNRAGVVPDHRGHGLQKRLIRVRMRYAKRIGWRWLITDTTENPPSANSLIGCGFRAYDPANPWGGRTTTYWRRAL